MRLPQRSLCLGSSFMLLAAIVEAHPGHEGHELTWGFGAGFGHPLSGWDHLLASLAIGWWSAQLSGRARWVVPSAFAVLLALGFVVGRGASTPPGVEQLIAASLMVLGLLLSVADRIPLAAAAAFAALFAVFHGLAHGAEMPRQTGALPFGIGLEVSSVGLMAMGLVLGLVASRLGRLPGRIAGLAVGIAGLFLLGLRG